MDFFRALVLILFAGLFFYVSHQLTRFADLGPLANISVIAFIALLFGLILTLPFYFWSLNHREHRSWHNVYYSLTHLAIGYVNFLVAFIIIRDVLSFVYHYATPDFNSEIWYNGTGTLVALILPLIFVTLGYLIVRSGPRLKKVHLKFPDLPPDLEGLRILHITDLHIGRNLPTNFVKKLVRVAQKHPADIVAMTGDMIDDVPVHYQEDLQLLKKIPHKYGVYYVPGNHEYYWHAERTIPEFHKLGFEVLINECRTLQVGSAKLQMCGIPDPAARLFKLDSPDFEKLAKTLAPPAFKVLLSHQPSLADKAAPLGIELQLSGHTHGGQFFPWNVLIGFFQKYGKGLYRILNLQLYVNQGTGYWGPNLRLGTYCEVAEITLLAK